MGEESNYTTIGHSSLDEANGNHNERQSPTSSVRSTRSARVLNEQARFSRSPGIRILQMAGKAPVYKCRFSVKDFRLQSPAIPDDGSDEYDTDLESEEVS